jgi:hypothetical protein
MKGTITIVPVNTIEIIELTIMVSRAAGVDVAENA